jgi:ubiquitin-protein ligase
MNVSRETLKRLASDIKNILKDNLHENNIYYKHDDEDILKGYALIIGPENTPYEYGYYLFEFIYPVDYPYNPPKVIFYTNDDNIRMNPNLYRNGKVCISILNTWKGEQWTSCQTIKTILLSLLTIFNDKPLLNEPGIKEDSKDFKPYNKIIRFKNIEIAIFKVIDDIIKDGMKFKINNHFKDIIQENFIKNYKNITSKVSSNNKCIHCENTIIYDMNVIIDYKLLLNNLEILYNKIKIDIKNL